MGQDFLDIQYLSMIVKLRTIDKPAINYKCPVYNLYNSILPNLDIQYLSMIVSISMIEKTR